MSNPVKEKLREKLMERRESREREESTPSPPGSPHPEMAEAGLMDSPEPQPGPSGHQQYYNEEAIKLWTAQTHGVALPPNIFSVQQPMVNFSPPARRISSQNILHNDSPAKMYRLPKAPDSTLASDPVDRLTSGLSSAKIYRSPKKNDSEQRDWVPRGPLDLRSPANLCRTPSPRTYDRPNVQAGEARDEERDYLGDIPAKIHFISPRKSPSKRPRRDKPVTVMIRGQPLHLGPDRIDSPQSPDTTGLLDPGPNTEPSSAATTRNETEDEITSTARRTSPDGVRGLGQAANITHSTTERNSER